jgi:hypothetical protein
MGTERQKERERETVRERALAMGSELVSPLRH